MAELVSKFVPMAEQSGNGEANKQYVAMAEQRRWRSKVAMVEKTSKYVARAKLSGNG